MCNPKTSRESRKIVNELCNKQSKTPTINNLQGNGENIVDGKRIAETLNDCFSNIGPNLANTQECSLIKTHALPDLCYSKNLCISLSTHNTSWVEKWFKTYNNEQNSWTCMTKFPPCKTLKEAGDSIVESLVYVFNHLSLKTGILPDNLKVACVHPSISRIDFCHC